MTQRIAALYDIHANLPALEAVLQEVRQTEVDGIVIGGDVLPGPMPRETLGRLADFGIPLQCICGNGEVAVLEAMTGREPVAVPKPYQPLIQWTAEQLHPEHQRWLSSWPKTLRVDVQGLGEVLFCHATPRNENDVFTRRTPEEGLLPIFEGLGVSTVVCGHTHMQFDRRIGTTRVVNAGSMGMPFGNPGAYWLLLGLDVHFRCTPYDFTEAAERIRATDYPQAETFAAQNVLQPPSEQQMLEAFARSELR
jgi:predicted phosphodiesterase